jgi:hypothetical protein
MVVSNATKAQYAYESVLNMNKEELKSTYEKYPIPLPKGKTIGDVTKVEFADSFLNNSIIDFENLPSYKLQKYEQAKKKEEYDILDRMNMGELQDVAKTIDSGLEQSKKLVTSEEEKQKFAAIQNTVKDIVEGKIATKDKSLEILKSDNVSESLSNYIRTRNNGSPGSLKQEQAVLDELTKAGVPHAEEVYKVSVIPQDRKLSERAKQEVETARTYIRDEFNFLPNVQQKVQDLSEPIPIIKSDDDDDDSPKSKKRKKS